MQQRKGNLHLTPFSNLMGRLKSEAALLSKKKGSYVSMNAVAIGYILAGLEQSAMRRRSAGNRGFAVKSAALNPSL